MNIDDRPIPGLDGPNGTVTYGELREQASAMAVRDYETSAEKGLAISILRLIEDAERLTEEKP